MTNQDDEATKNLVTATEAKLRQEYDLTKAPGFKMYPEIDSLCRKWPTLHDLRNAYYKAFNLSDPVRFIHGANEEHVFCTNNSMLVSRGDEWARFRCNLSSYGISGSNEMPFPGAVLGVVGARIAMMAEKLPTNGLVDYQNAHWCDPVKLGEDCLYNHHLLFEQALVDFSSRFRKEGINMAQMSSRVKTALSPDAMEGLGGVDVYRPDPSKEWFIAKDSVTGTSVTFFGLHCANTAMEKIRQARVARVAEKLKGDSRENIREWYIPADGYTNATSFIQSQLSGQGVPVQKLSKDYFAAIYKKGVS